MSYSDDLTEEKLKNLTNELSNLYKKATNEALVITSDYLSKFVDRDEKLKEELKDKEAYRAKYCVGASAHMTPEQHYKQWRLAQVGRGKRWKAVQDDVAKRISTANQEAEGIINSTLPGVYADNHNFSAYEIEKQSGVAFNIVNEEAITELNTGVNHTDFRTVRVNPTRDYNWNSKRIQGALTAGLLQGKSIPRLAEDFMQVMGSNKAAAIRNARTAVTSAQAAGRVQAYKEAEEMGIELQKEWVSAHDARVRDSHAHLDGVRVGMDEVFPNGCRYPADPEGKPAEVYNCRCTLKAILPKYNGNVRTNNSVRSYKEWMNGKNGNEKISNEVFAYHATTNSALVGIVEKGLKPNRGHFGKGVYFANSPDDALEWTSETSTGGKIILRVAEDFLSDGDYEKYSENETGYYRAENIYSGTIPLEKIEIRVSTNSEFSNEEWWSLANYAMQRRNLVFNKLSKKAQSKVEKINSDEFKKKYYEKG